MPRSNWIMAGMTMTAAIAMGFGLGAYATSPQGTSPADEPIARSTFDPASPIAVQDVALRGPVEVKCTGCGPTLAERRWQADMAGWEPEGMGGDSADPVVRDYLADEPVDESAPPPPPTIERLPANIVRFASSDMAGRPAVDERAPDGETSPPPLVRTAAAAMP